MMSLVDIPSWMQKGKTRNREVRFRGREGGMLAADLYALDYRKIVDSLSDVKSIGWASFGKYPYYVVNSGSKKTVYRCCGYELFVAFYPDRRDGA